MTITAQIGVPVDRESSDVLEMHVLIEQRRDRQGGSTDLSGSLGEPLGLIRDKGNMGSEAEMGGMSDLFKNRDGERTSPFRPHWERFNCCLTYSSPWSRGEKPDERPL